MGRYTSLDNPYGMEEREPVGIFIGLQCGFVHQAADGIVRQQQTIEFLLDQFRCFAAQHNLSAAQMRFKLVQGDFDFPPFMIECC